MVVTAQRLATQVGVDVLKQGGNAVDAAVAVGYALAVVYPAAGNLGGGGFMTLQMADGRKRFIDFREKAPLAARPDMYLDADGKKVKGLSVRGHLAVAVPGTVAGLELAREKYGTRKRELLIAPAIRLAKGFVLDQGDADMLSAAAESFRLDEASAAIFLNHDLPFEAKQTLVQSDLARTLSAISAQGAKGFYQGPVGMALVRASQIGGGLITQADLDQYQARERAPIECNYRGFHIVSAPPPSSGGVVLCEMLNILEGYPLKDFDFHSAQAVHVQIEAMRRAYVDRNYYFGDPDFVNNPVAPLLDKAYAERMRMEIPSDRALSSEIQPGLGPRSPNGSTSSSSRPQPSQEGTNTTHYSIVDRWGNAVAVTYTLNGWFGARVTAAGTGVLLNNEMDDFTSKLGEGNSFGLVQGEANAIAPGKRPLSSMSPTIVSRSGKPLLILGTPGGSRIPTTVLQTIVNVIDYRMDIEQAVAAPRFHQQWLPEETSVEDDVLLPEVRDQLLKMGHKLRPSRPANQVAAILIGAPSLDEKPVGKNRYYGTIDPRRTTGLAKGY